MLEVMIDTTVDTIHMVGGGIQAEISVSLLLTAPVRK